MSTEYELRSQNINKYLLNMNCDHKMLTNVDVKFTFSQNIIICMRMQNEIN